MQINPNEPFYPQRRNELVTTPNGHIKEDVYDKGIPIRLELAARFMSEIMKKVVFVQHGSTNPADELIRKYAQYSLKEADILIEEYNKIQT